MWDLQLIERSELMFESTWLFILVGDDITHIDAFDEEIAGSFIERSWSQNLESNNVCIADTLHRDEVSLKPV